MKPRTSRLTELYQLGTETAGILELPRKFWPNPGQYLTCQAAGKTLEVLPHHLFRVIGSPTTLNLGPIPPGWAPGDEITFLPPQGRGFSPPETIHRAALLAMGVSPARLLPLISTVNSSRASITLFCDPAPAKDLLNFIPSAVEVASVADLQENLDWPDYLAVDLELPGLPELSNTFDWEVFQGEAQALIRTAMPCHGVGNCGVCSVKTNRGWRLACTDGPVFNLNEVLDVA